MDEDDDYEDDEFYSDDFEEDELEDESATMGSTGQSSKSFK